MIAAALIPLRSSLRRGTDPATALLQFSTERRYAQAVEHFEASWGGLLPASSASVAGYLAAYGARLTAITLRTDLAALAQRHQQRGFPDPTKTAQVRDTLRGIQASSTTDQTGHGAAVAGTRNQHR